MLRIFSICLVALAVVAMPGDDAFSASKKKKTRKGLGSRDQYTSQQREALYQAVLQRCRKKFGPTAHVVINYSKPSFTCWLQ